MKKGVQIAILVFLILVIISGGCTFLLKMEILPVPAFLKSIPLISSHLPPDRTPAEDTGDSPDVSDEKDEPDERLQLEKQINDREKEIDKLNTQLNDMEKELASSLEAQQALQEQVLQLQDEVAESLTMKQNQADTYKNLAEYYAVMKAQNAAAIISQLKDEEIIGIFNHMDSETVADILQSMDKSKAAALSKKMLATTAI